MSDFAAGRKWPLEILTTLNGFEGIPQVDGYTGYTRLAQTQRGVRPTYCWSHAKPKLRDVFEGTSSKAAAEGLRRIAELYAIEADISCASPERRLAEHRVRTAPLVEKFGVWIKEQRARVSAKSRFGEALARRSGFDEVEIDRILAQRQPEEQWLFRANWPAHDYRERPGRRQYDGDRGEQD